MRYRYKSILILCTLLPGCATHCTKGGVWSSYYDAADTRCAYFCADKEEKYCAKSKSDAEKLECCSVKWINDVLDPKILSGQLSSREAANQLKLDKHQCMLEALKIPVPSPSCTQRSYNPGISTGNSVFDAYQHGAAVARANMGPDCDYSSVRYATKAQEDVFWSCMSVKGWEQIWVRKTDGKRMGTTSDRTIPRD